MSIDSGTLHRYKQYYNLSLVSYKFLILNLSLTININYYTSIQ